MYRIEDNKVLDESNEVVLVFENCQNKEEILEVINILLNQKIVKIKADQVFDAIQKALGVTRRQLSSRSRKTNLTDARLIFSKTLHNAGFTHKNIAGYLNRNRETIYNTLKTADNLIISNRAFRDKLKKVQKELLIVPHWN